MKVSVSRFKKLLIILAGSVLVLMALVIALSSPLAKYLVEKYDVKLTGRNIESDWMYVNPFTGYVHFSMLKIFESATLRDLKAHDSLFFSADGLSANFALLKLLRKTVEISEVTLDKPKGIVLQDQKIFNFNDLILKFSPKKTNPAPSKIRFSILKIKIHDGEFHYREKRIPINYFIKKVNLESTGKRYDSDTIAVRFSLVPGFGTGNMKGDFSINFKTNEYRVAVVVQKFDLNIIEQYLRDMMNYGSFTANLDADIRATGSFKDAENSTTSGMIAINDFHFGKNPENDFLSFDKLVLAITTINPKKNKYNFDSVSLTHPFLLYERYDSLDNIQNMFGKKGANISAASADPAKFNLVIEIAKYVKVLAKNFFHSNYKINRLAVYDGNVIFNDFAVSEKFSIALNPLYFMADSIDKNNKRVFATFNSGIKPYGNATINLSINPRDSVDFDLRYHLLNLPASMFNPYLVTYTSYPLDRGTLELNGTWKVRNAMIQSDNHLVVIDPRRSKRLRNKDKSWLPLPLIMSLIREKGNVIDYEIPITGNLADPTFHLHDVVMDLLENIFVKPATTSYRMKVKNLEADIEKSLTLTWRTRQNSLQHDQEKFLEKMADYLKDNPEASIAVYPMNYNDKEIEHILFFEAKKKYFLSQVSTNHQIISESDSLLIDKMSVKDSVFVQYLNNTSDDPMLFTIQEKCRDYVGYERINARYNQLKKERENTFLNAFRIGSVKSQVKINIGEDHVPFNGFSFYKISYNGELPVSLIRSYSKMNNLNNIDPRKKYKNDRKRAEVKN